MTLPPWLRGARAAVTFLTRVPIGGWPYSADDWRWASGHFPLVGAGIGAAIGAVFALALPLSPLAAAGLALAFGLLLTGGFHEDGLADTADALGGGYEPARVFEILKDSRIGAFGAAALIVALLLRAALLIRLGPAAAAALVACECASRLPPIWLMAALPYVTADASAKSRLVARARPAQALAATLLCASVLAAGVLLDGWTLAQALALPASGLAVAVVSGWRFHARLGGVTGDFLGATQQVVEAAILAIVLLASR